MEVDAGKTLCFIFISFSISKIFICNFCVCGTNKLWPFKQKVYKVIQYCYEIFQTILNLNRKIIQLKRFNLVINLTLISNKVSNLFSAICSEINAVQNNLIQGVAISLRWSLCLLSYWRSKNRLYSKVSKGLSSPTLKCQFPLYNTFPTFKKILNISLKTAV